MKTFGRVLLLIAGILMIIMGIWLLFNPVATLLASNVFFAIVLLVSGIFHTVSYFSDKKLQHVSGWVLAEGILSILLGVFMLFNEIAGAATLVMLFAMWVLFAGIMRIISSMSAKNNNVSGWGWLLALGIIGVVLGFIAMFDPVVSVIGIVIVMATFFIVQGISAIASFFFLGKFSK
ncbi:HdeD family acid-resistance protein [Listeria costaricensis]|uniref:HdeD family acid-resistance protein n=1 Tax=Listeria costaricensis TaxID=2026604 RepID=UPI000C0713FE|nr:HdeD family acid-resistance protein [Listeria costaricensis]